MTTTEKTNNNAYSEKLQARLDQWHAELDKLEAKTRESKADARIELMENVNKVKERWETARSKAREVQKSSGEAWKELRKGTEDAFESLKDAVHRAQSQL